jgi:hypothetical protein
MSISNTVLHPSRIEDRICDLMAEEQFIISTDVYTDTLFCEIYKMLYKEFPEIEWEAFSTKTPIEGVWAQSFAWVEDGHIHLLGWYYKDTEVE